MAELFISADLVQICCPLKPAYSTLLYSYYCVIMYLVNSLDVNSSYRLYQYYLNKNIPAKEITVLTLISVSFSEFNTVTLQVSIQTKYNFCSLCPQFTVFKFSSSPGPSVSCQVSQKFLQFPVCFFLLCSNFSNTMSTHKLVVILFALMERTIPHEHSSQRSLLKARSFEFMLTESTPLLK